MTAEDWREEARRLLVDSSLVWVGRSVDMGDFQLVGAGGDKIALHVQCPFRVLFGEKVLLGSQDIRYQRGDEFDRTLAADSLYDSRARRLASQLEERRPTVIEVEFREAGALVLRLQGALVIETFPNASRPDEAWRVFRRGSDTHVVYPPLAASVQ